MSLLVVGTLLLTAAVGLFAQALLGDPVRRVSKRRRLGRDVVTEPLWRVTYRGIVLRVDKVLKSRGWVPFRAAELEMADVGKPLGVIVTWVAGLTVVAALVGLATGGGPVRVLMMGVLVPVGAKLWLRMRSGKRRKAFGKQLDNTLRIISSALRAGQSLQMAMHSVAADSSAPMSEEITRVINETRLGRDLVQAMLETAERMRSEDFRWFAEAVEVQRDSGGNLNDIIETVAETIRGRAEIREKIRAFSAEGKASCYVLMALPIGLAVLYSLMNPGYLSPLFHTTVGLMLVALSAVLYAVAYVWMRAIVAIKV
jgi:tight adherence protein B